MSVPNQSNYKYAVAISLLSRDLHFAQQLEAELHKILGPDQPVFLYTSRQNEIAVSGGLFATFNQVFRKEARVVLVLYRQDWGLSGFTSIEKDALMARRNQTGSWRFVRVVSLDPPHVPDWYSSDYYRFDVPPTRVDTIAAAVAMLVEEFGGVGLVVESPEQTAKRLRDEEYKRNMLASRLMSREGGDRFKAEVQAVCDELKATSARISMAGNNDPMTFSLRDRKLAINYRDISLLVYWHIPYGIRDEGARR
jgi:hypothetical protein